MLSNHPFNRTFDPLVVFSVFLGYCRHLTLTEDWSAIRTHSCLISVQHPKSDFLQWVKTKMCSMQNWIFGLSSLCKEHVWVSWSVPRYLSLETKADISFSASSPPSNEKSNFSVGQWPFHSIWKTPKMSYLNFSILAFSTNFCLF